MPGKLRPSGRRKDSATARLIDRAAAVGLIRPLFEVVAPDARFFIAGNCEIAINLKIL
jgi:hypothetical protein